MTHGRGMSRGGASHTQGKQPHRFGSVPEKLATTGFCGGTCGRDIVYQQDPSGHRVATTNPSGEGAEAFGSAQSSQHRPSAHGQGVNNRNTGLLGNDLGEHTGRSESAQEAPGPWAGHGNQCVKRVRPDSGREPVGAYLGKLHHQVALAAVFCSLQCVGDGTVEAGQSKAALQHVRRGCRAGDVLGNAVVTEPAHVLCAATGTGRRREPARR